MTISPYDSEVLRTELLKIKEKYPNHPKLKECGDKIRKAKERAGQSGHMDRHYIHSYLGSKEWQCDEPLKSFYGDVYRAVYMSFEAAERK